MTRHAEPSAETIAVWKAELIELALNTTHIPFQMTARMNHLTSILIEVDGYFMLGLANSRASWQSDAAQALLHLNKLYPDG